MLSEAWSWRASWIDASAASSDDTQAAAQREPEDHADHDDHDPVGGDRLGRHEGRLEHPELLAELAPLEVRLHARLEPAVAEVLVALEEMPVLALQGVELLGHPGRLVEQLLDLRGHLLEARDLLLGLLPAAAWRARPRPSALSSA